MTIQNITRIGIIGLGLIGGSLAALIKEKQPKYHVKGHDPNPDTAQLINNGMLDVYCESIQSLVKDVELVIIATPIDAIINTIETVAKYASADTIITDVASIKVPIVDQLKEANYQQTIIPGHPMGGSDQTGFTNASAHYLYDTHYIITPLGNVPDHFKQFLTGLSFNVVKMTAQRHDQLVGLTSHLPYLISVILTNILRSESDVPDLADLATVLGPGIKDMTRLSQSSVEWGKSVSLYNKDTLISLLNNVQSHTNTLIQTLKDDNESILIQQLQMAQQCRQDFPSF